MRKFILILSLLLLCVSVISCESNSYCPENETIKAHNKLGDIFNEFDMKVNSIGYIVYQEDFDDLDQIYNKVQNLEVPECLDKSKYYLLKIIDASTNGFYLYMMGDIDGMNEQIIKSSELTIQANEELEKIRRCLPNCSREDME